MHSGLAHARLGYSGLLAAGASREEILADYPYLKADDITAALECGSAAAGHRVIAAERKRHLD